VKPTLYKWKSISLAPTATFKAPINPKRRLEGFQLYITGNHPPWLPQPPSCLPTPRNEKGGKKRGEGSANEVPANNDSPIIRHFRKYPCISPLQ
jgi:hypothetical protein